MKKSSKNRITKVLILSLVILLVSCKKEDKKGTVHHHDTIGDDLSYTLKPTNASAVSSVKTISPIQRSMEVKSEATGVIAYDTRRVFNIPIRVGGRIEKLYIQYNFQPIKKGQKILEIYSPELVTFQKELLYLTENDNENKDLIQSAKQRLRLLGVTETQIDQLINSKNEVYSFPVFSPEDGYVIEETTTASALPNSSSGSMGGSMGGGSASPPKISNSTPTNIREGIYLNPGQTVFKVINTDKVWAEFSLPQKEAINIKIKDPVEIKTGASNEAIPASVDFVQPFFENGGNFTLIRIYLTNKDRQFNIGELISAEFKSITEDALWLPVSSIVNLGNSSVVFVKGEQTFTPKTVSLGNKSGKWVEIVDGLSEQELIAENAQFLVDSESFIRVN